MVLKIAGRADSACVGALVRNGPELWRLDRSSRIMVLIILVLALQLVVLKTNFYINHLQCTRLTNSDARFIHTNRQKIVQIN